MMAAGSNGASPQTNPWALNYYNRGLQTVPGRAGGKSPLFAWAEFQNGLMPQSRFDGWFGPEGDYSETTNIGFLTGACSLCGLTKEQTAGLFVLDCDVGGGKRGIDRWNAFWFTYLNGIEPETWMARSGGGGLHIYFLAPPDWTPPTVKLGDWDVRGQGGYVVAPPSVHASGTRYEWLEGRAPWETSIGFAPRELRDEIDHCRGEVAGQVNGQRVDIEGQFSALGVQTDGRETRMRDTIFAVLVDCRRELGDIDDPLNHPHVAAERERAWGLYESRVKLRENDPHGRPYFDRHWSYTARQWNGKLKGAAGQPKPAPRPKDEPAQAGFFDAWATAPAAEFPLDRVPKPLPAFIETKAAAIGVRQGGLALCALTVISGAIDQQTRLKMQAGYFAPPNFWGLMVADPGQKKSPIIKAAVGPLRAIEAQHGRDRTRDYARWKELGKEAGEPAPPPALRYVLNDTTPEAMAKILAQQDRGILMVHDEFGTLIGSFDRYNSSNLSARAFICQARQGGPFTLDRKTDGSTVYINNLSCSILGAVQPELIGSLGNLTQDGILQRFNPVVLEDGPPFEPAEDELAVKRYEDLIGYLTALKPATVSMTNEAYLYSVKLRHELDDFAREFRGHNGHLQAWANKLGDTLGNVALILHVIEHKKDFDVDALELRTMENAAAILNEFLIPNAMLFYEDVATGGGKDNLQRVASWILRAQQDVFTYSDLRYNTRIRGIDTPQQLINLIAPLADTRNGWLSSTEDYKPQNPRWALRQGVREAFPARIAELDKHAESYRQRFKGRNGADGD